MSIYLFQIYKGLYKGYIHQTTVELAERTGYSNYVDKIKHQVHVMLGVEIFV